MKRPPLTPAALDALEAIATDATVGPFAHLAWSVLAIVEEVRAWRQPRPATPTHRRSLRYSPRIGGGTEAGGTRAYVSVDVVEGSIVAVWVDVEHRQGTTLVEDGHVLARLASRALQAGAELGDVVDDLRGTAGGPGGVVHDCEGVEGASSLADLVGRVLEQAARDLS